MHQLTMRPFKSFWDEPKTHRPLPKVFGFFNLFFAPKFFPPTYLPPTYLPLPTSLLPTSPFLPTSSHFVLIPTSELGRAWNERPKVVTNTTHLKWEPKLKGQNGSLKVNSLPSLHFFGFFFYVVLLQWIKCRQEAVVTLFSMFKKKKMTIMCCHFLSWFCCKK
jgi:hypothetical protein